MQVSTFTLMQNVISKLYEPKQRTKGKNDPSSSHTSPHHYSDALDRASNIRIRYTTSASHPSRRQTHLLNKTPPAPAHQHRYANLQPSLTEPHILALLHHRPALQLSAAVSGWHRAL
jgi:hypothetical protein